MNRFEQIAEGLADTGYSIVDSFLTQQETDAILQLDEFQGGLLPFRKAGIGNQQERTINARIRGDYVKWITRDSAAPAIQVYLNRLDELIGYLNQSLFLSLKDFEVHLTIYPVGTSYQRHIDQFKRDDHRRLSIILYLNKNWSDDLGGQLRMHLPGATKDIVPQEGRLVCFRSDLIEHEVLPASRERLSITGWILDRPVDLKHL